VQVGGPPGSCTDVQLPARAKTQCKPANVRPPMSAAQTFPSTAQRLSDVSAIARETI